MIFRPGSTVLLFSRRDEEATALLDRLKEMTVRLPGWLKPAITISNDHELNFGLLGSKAQAFPTTKHSARSYTATLVIIDEADFIQWIKQLITAVKPTIDAGGKMVLLSTANKDAPDSEYKRIWSDAFEGLSNYHPIFLPWSAHPERNETWYSNIKLEYTTDDLYQEYPATPQQALAPRLAAKRFHPDIIDKCTSQAENLTADAIWATYRLPQAGSAYLLSADPAEGNPSSDPSAAVLLNAETWEEVAHLHGQFEPEIFAGYLVQAARQYNGATICVERNNHGHAVQLAVKNLEAEELLYLNPYDNKDGWLSNSKYKTLAVDVTVQALRESSVTIHTKALAAELAMFEARTLKAPEGFHDDRAMALINAVAALRWPSRRLAATGASEVITAPDVIDTIDKSGGW